MENSSTPTQKSSYGVELSDRANTTKASGSQVASRYISGRRLHLISFALFVSLFIAQIEMSITSTAVIAITDDLGGFAKSPWIFTAYWLTSSAFQIIWAKLSDIVGRKTAIIVAVLIFTAFSGACGGAQTVFQLIMVRWVQGIGGSGILALVSLIFFELRPKEQWPLYVSIVTGVISLSLIVGPLIGGAITRNGSWRWIFLMNVPIGAVAMVGLLWVFPSRLWNEPAAQYTGSNRTLKRVDFLGAILLLGSCLLLTTALQEAALGYAFDSSLLLPLFICAAILIVAFFTWQWFVTTRRTRPEPVFPWRFCQSRVAMGMILNTWLTGTIITVLIVQIPQRFIAVNGKSPLAAAVRLLPFGALIPAGSALAAPFMGKGRVLPVLVILVGVAMELLGCIFLSRVSNESSIDGAQYGLQVLTGLGAGLIIAALALLLPYVTEKRDLAVGTAMIIQFRVLGGLIALAIATTMSTRYLRSHLQDFLTPNLVGMLLERTDTINQIAGAQLGEVRRVFGEAYNLQVKLLIGFAAAQIPATALMWTNQRITETTGED